MTTTDTRPAVSAYEIQARELIEAFRDDQEAQAKPFVVRQILLLGLKAIWAECFTVKRLCEVSSALAGTSIDQHFPGVNDVLRDAIKFGLLRKHAGMYEINLK